MPVNLNQLNLTILLDKLVNGLIVEPNTVANISVIAQLENTSANFDVGAGAGAHIIFPILPQNGNFVVNIGRGAHVVLSLLGQDDQNHNLNLSFNFIGPGANAHFQVATIHSHSSQSELSCEFIHTSPQTYGRMLVRRIVIDKARGVFKGMLRVNTLAQGTDTYLSDKALLLGDQAQATSDPRLEILANDVKASHGATIGKLSDEEIFYIRSRGIDLIGAKSLLVKAFLQPALVGVPADLVRSLQVD